MSINFTLNNGSTLTLGKEDKSIRVVIHDGTKAETPTTVVTDYTAKLFAEAGLTHKPTFDEYKATREKLGRQGDTESSRTAKSTAWICKMSSEREKR